MLNECRIKDLLVKSIQGDKASYNLFLLNISPYIENRVRRKIFKQDDILDVKQDILISIHRSLNSFDLKRTSLPWLSTIIERRIIDYIRKVTKPYEFEVFNESALDVTYSQLDSKYDLEDLNILECLPEKTKLAIIYTKIDGHSTKVAAEMLNIKENALRTRISRGISKARNLIVKKEDG
jgi:RNA polymerase sigma-70 factor (ECF subfamily)